MGSETWELVNAHTLKQTVPRRGGALLTRYFNYKSNQLLTVAERPSGTNTRTVTPFSEVDEDLRWQAWAQKTELERAQKKFAKQDAPAEKPPARDIVAPERASFRKKTAVR